VQFLVCAAGLLSVVWFQPHYAAPLAATLFGFWFKAMSICGDWNLGAERVGIF